MNKLVEFEKYNSDFNWDYKLHFPVPTLNYILRRTGQDVLRYFDSSPEAEGNIIAITRTSMNFLFANRIDKQAWIYSIAHDLDLIYQVLEYILEFINFAFVTGNYENIFNFQDTKRVSPAIIDARASLLGATKVLPFNTKIGVGY